MKTILVTGGAGFIGSNFLHLLHRRHPENRILLLDALTYAGNLDNLPGPLKYSPNFEFHHGSVTHAELVQNLVRRSDVVIHFAAESHVDRSIDGPMVFVETNVAGTCRLLEEVRRYWSGLSGEEAAAFRFLHVSTDEVYGSLGETGRFTETTPYAPRSPYAASKAASDHFVRAWHHTWGLPVLLTNCSNNYGPYQFPEKLIPLMILNALEGRPLPVYGDGLNVRDWLYVEDHCEAIETVLRRGAAGECYNIGGDNERTNIDIVRTICEIIDRLCPDLPHHPCESLIEFVADRPGHDRRYAIDASKIRRTLHWEPRTDFAAGIETTVRWYLDNRRWVERVQSGTYRRERLGHPG